MCRGIAFEVSAGHASGQGNWAPAQQEAETFVSAFLKKLAATYSRGVYKTTTIGKTVFDGRVRNGIGSDHSFMTTKNWLIELIELIELIR